MFRTRHNRLLRRADTLLKTSAEEKELRIEAEVQRSHVFDVVLSRLPGLIGTLDPAGRFTYANPALPGVWQKTLPEFIGKNTFDLGLSSGACRAD